MSNFKERIAQAGSKRSEPSASPKVAGAGVRPQQAQARWPMMQSTALKKWEGLPAMSQEEKENWQLPEPVRSERPFVQPAQSGLSTKLARGLSKMTPEQRDQSPEPAATLHIPPARRTVLAKARLSEAEPVPLNEQTPLATRKLSSEDSIQDILGRLVGQPPSRESGSVSASLPRSSFLSRLGKR